MVTQITIFAVFIAGLIGLFKPVYGFGIFLLGFSGSVGLFEKMGLLGAGLGPIRPDNAAFLGAIISLLIRENKSKYKEDKSIDGLAMALWVLTIAILGSRVVELFDRDSWLIVRVIYYCCTIAPCYLAINNLTPIDYRKLENIIILVSAITGGVMILIVMTGNERIYELFVFTKALEQFQSLNIEGKYIPKEFEGVRFILPGVWTILPLGFWLATKKILIYYNKSKALITYYISAFITIMFGIMFNYSRSVFLGISCGIFIMLGIILTVGKKRKSEIITYVMPIIITLIFVGIYHGGVFEKWGQRLGEKINESSLTMRVDKTSYLMNILAEEINILGHYDDNRKNNVEGDAYPFVSIWWDYGLIASIFYFIPQLLIFIKIFKYLKYYERLSREELINCTSWLGYLIMLQFIFIGGGTMTMEMNFCLVFSYSGIYHLAIKPLTWKKCKFSRIL